MTAPTDRNMSTRVMPQVMSVLDLSNCLARFVTVSDTVKKSKASQVYPCQMFLAQGRTSTHVEVTGEKSKDNAPMLRTPRRKTPIAAH
jgi:hypothetical protein